MKSWEIARSVGSSSTWRMKIIPLHPGSVDPTLKKTEKQISERKTWMTLVLS